MKKNDAGFTLLEIILSLSILATIGVITINILGDQIATRQKLAQLNNDEHSLNAALSRITQDLQASYISDPANAASLNLTSRSVTPQFKFNNDNLTFFTMAFNSILCGSNQSNQAFVRYFTRSDPNDSNIKQLIRVVDTDFADSIEQDDVGISRVLLDDVESFTVEFWNGETYVKEWDTKGMDSQNKLPKMVKVHLSSYSSEPKSQFQSKVPEKRKTYSLDTVVFLTNTQEQKEVQTPTWNEFKWQ